MEFESVNMGNLEALRKYAREIIFYLYDFIYIYKTPYFII